MDLSEQSERMQSFFNLKHDPFGSVVDAMVFSGAGSRYETAETIRHLLNYSQQDSVLLGAGGSGKRMLAQQVLKLLEEHWRVAWIDASELDSVPDLEKEIIGQLGLGLRSDGTEVETEALIAKAVEDRLEEESFLLVVQFAERLPEQVFEWLLSLRQHASDADKRVRQLWLCDAATFDSTLLVEEDWSFHTLESFSDAEAEQYLKDRLIAAGFTGELPLSKKDVVRINQISNGLPEELNTAARDFLIGSTFKTTEKSQPFPITHVIAGLAALCLVVVAFLYQRGEKQQEPQLVELDKPAESMTAVEKRLADAVAKVEAKQQNTDSTSPNTVLEQPVSESESVILEVSEEDVQEPTTVVEPDGADSTQESEREEPVQSAVAEINQTESSTNKGDALLNRGLDAEFTMQLIGVRDESKLDSLIAEFPERNLVDVLETTYEGKPWFVLIYGQFDSKATAQAAIPSLPESLKETQPWIRTFASLRNSQ